uniref:DNA-directed primase/polymerase protein n=1 Tax=Angiostrongylus cantonensis TaxID=6313 RepID=A0A0K0DK91_ANGCA
MHSKLATTTSDADPEDSFNDTVHLDDSWFYGPPRKKQMLDCMTKENLTASTLVNPKRSSLVEKSFGEMETFSKQRLAIGKLEESLKVFKNSRIFSFEKPEQTNGERRYLVSTLERFWSWYETLKDRHFYELIIESSPCRLYFDLEYSKATNANIDHEVSE